MRPARILTALSLLLMPMIALAEPLRVNTGVRVNLAQGLAGIIDILAGWAVPVGTAWFLAGAFVMVASGGGETGISRGKKMMISALIGIAIILGSYIILSAVVSLLL